MKLARGMDRPEIDWDWVEREVLKSERIPLETRDSLKDAILAALRESLKAARSLVEPRAISIPKKIAELKADSIVLDRGVVFSGKRLSSYIKGATGLHLFLVTIGKEIEAEASAAMSKGEGLAGYLLDRIGSLAVESLAESMETGLRGLYAADEKSVSMRLSPGYCDWPIEEQFVMAKVLNFGRIGVSLIETCMMVPRKSISAMVGVAPKGIFSKDNSQCAACEMSNCDYRRIC